MKRVWIEKTEYKGDPSRINGDRALGKAIWVPQSDNTSSSFIQNISQGDIIIHLIDNKFIRSISIVKSDKISECSGIEGTKWDNKTDCYIWYLDSTINLSYSLSKNIILSRDNEYLLAKISELSEVFYTKNLGLRPKAYITPCTKELLTYLNHLYKNVSGDDLPYISKQLIYNSFSSFVDAINNNFDEIKERNNEFRLKNKSKIVHDNGVVNLADDFIKCLNFKEEEVYRFVKTGRGGGDIDLVVGFEETAIVIEYKTRSQTPDLKKEFDVFYGKRDKFKKIIKENDLFKSKYKKFVFIYVVYRFNLPKLIKMRDVLSNEGYSIGKDCFVFHQDMIKEYFDMGKSVDAIYSRRELLKYLNIYPLKKTSLTIPAIRTDFENMHLYTFSCSAKYLTKFATVSRKLLGSKGYSAYQRRLDGKRLKEISKFLDDKGNFVNNIIIRFNPDNIEFKKYKLQATDFTTASKIHIGLLNISPTYHSSFVIDGQHRLFSYLKTNKDSNITVSGLVNITDWQEAKYFLDINDKGKSVPKDLIWDLDGDIDPSGERGIISNAIKNLCQRKDENNIFFENLKIPSLEHKGFSFSGLCTYVNDLKYTKERWIHLRDSSATVKNPLYNKNPNILTKNLESTLANFFIMFNSFLRKDFKYFEECDIKETVFTDTLLGVYLKIAKYYFIFINNRKIKDDIFIKEFSKIINRYSVIKKAEIRSVTSKTLMEKYLKEIVPQLQDSFDSKFGPVIEDDFGKEVNILINETFPDWVNDKLRERLPDIDWVEKHLESNDNKYKKLRIESVQQGRPIHRLISWDTYKQIIKGEVKTLKKYKLYEKIFFDLLLSKKSGFLSLIDIDSCFEQLMGYRNMAMAHGSRDNYTNEKRQKVQAYYTQLIQLISEQ